MTSDYAPSLNDKLAGLPHEPLRRVNAHDGLEVTVATWDAAHEYHHRLSRLLTLNLHGSGVCRGLQVSPTAPPSLAVRIAPGIAVDETGRVVLVPGTTMVALPARAGTFHVVLRFAEHRPDDDFVEEVFSVAAVEATAANEIELARVKLAPSAAAVLAPIDHWAPKENEIDTRFRNVSCSVSPERLVIELLQSSQGQSARPGHLTGLQMLLQELRRANIVARVTSSTSNSPAHLVYVTGGAADALPEDLVAKVQQRLSEGAFVLADSCGVGEAFFQSLTPALEEAGHHDLSHLLTARYVFGEPPLGANDAGSLHLGKRIVVSSRDYGCAWSGRSRDQAISREVVRAATEFGVNVATLACQPA